MSKITIKVLQANGLEHIYTGDATMWNPVTQVIHISDGLDVNQVQLESGQRAFVMNGQGNTISIYKAR